MELLKVEGPDVGDLVRAEWPPLRHVRRGWAALSPEERGDVARRVEAVLAQHTWGPHPRDSLLHLFTFLAQVETIAIEIPLRFLPHAAPEVQPLLRRQLVDEVFHSTIFARLAHELALPRSQPPTPLASADRLLERIRREPDLAITATMLNLVAEGWIETLFKHALRWGVANAVFKAVLADEARHVDEAEAYIHDVDPKAAEAAIRSFEDGMMQVGAEPAVALALLDLAGERNYRQLTQALYRQHVRQLRVIGLQPSLAWQQAAAAAEAFAARIEPIAMPQAVPDTNWRRLARRVWEVPRDPTMQGDFDVPVGHIPRKVLTPVLIAALGRAWKAHPELNRIVARDRVWELPHANVGVRVLLDDGELATVLIHDADRRSVRDIQRMLRDGIGQLRRSRDEARARPPDAKAPPVPDPEPELAALVPAAPMMFAVAISNAGKWGVVSGAGSFSGWVSPSTDITVGVRRRMPRWRGVAYFPAWHVNVAAIQDHRVFDGRASATGVTAIQAALSPKAVRDILDTADTLPSEAELEHASTSDAVAAAVAVPILGASPLAALGSLALPKYTPFVIGGLAIGALAGIGGYLAYQSFNAPAAAAAGGAAATGPAAGAAASTKQGAGPSAPPMVPAAVAPGALAPAASADRRKQSKKGSPGKPATKRGRMQGGGGKGKAKAKPAKSSAAPPKKPAKSRGKGRGP